MLLYLVIVALMPVKVLSIAGLQSSRASIVPGYQSPGINRTRIAIAGYQSPGIKRLDPLVIAASKPAIVLAKSGKASADAHAVGHSKEEQDRYIEITKHLGNIWSKLLFARERTDNSDFLADCNTVIEKVEELANEMTKHYYMNAGNMKEKAKSVLSEMLTLKSKHTPLKSDMKHNPSGDWTEKDVNEMIKNSQEILKMMGCLAEAKNGSHEAIEKGNKMDHK